MKGKEAKVVFVPCLKKQIVFLKDYHGNVDPWAS